MASLTSQHKFILDAMAKGWKLVSQGANRDTYLAPPGFVGYPWRPWDWPDDQGPAHLIRAATVRVLIAKGFVAPSGCEVSEGRVVAITYTLT